METETMKVASKGTKSCTEVINGKKYSTETAEYLLTLYNGVRRNQRDYYVTKKGTFFVHYVEVDKLELVPEYAMRSILAEHNVELYERFFGEVEEG